MLAVPVGMRLYGIPGGYRLWSISIFYLQFTAREVLPAIEGKVNADVAICSNLSYKMAKSL